MIFALVHATLGWALASLAALLLRNCSVDARCWAWRVGLLKGPIALLLTVPIVVQVPANDAFVSSQMAVSVLATEASSTLGREHVLSQRIGFADASTRASSGYRVGQMRLGKSMSEGASTPKRDAAALPFSPLPLAYLFGVAAVLTMRLCAARRTHRAMPRVVGILRPQVMIPKDLTPEETAIALAHETGHVRRRDPQWSLVADLVCAAFWFAPPVWLCARAMRAEAEAACDAIALRETGASRRAYARLLLAHVGPAPANALGGSARRLARRILMLERTTKPLARPVAGIFVAVGLVGLLPWRAVAQSQPIPVASEAGPLKGFGAGLPATRLPLHTAASMLLEESGVKAQVGWTAAQDAEVKRAHDRWEASMNAFRAEIVRRQKTQTLREALAWDNRERGNAFDRAQKAYGNFPWTSEQERTLKSLALVRFGSAVWLDPEIANRLRLTNPQRRAITRENGTIAHTFSEASRTYELSVPPPATVTARFKALETKYLDASPGERSALYLQMSKLERSYPPSPRIVAPYARKRERETSLARSWTQRADADRRLMALLTDEQRRTLDALKTDPTAWVDPLPAGLNAPANLSRPKDYPTFEASELALTSGRMLAAKDLTINRKPISVLFEPRMPNDLVKVIRSVDGTEWRISRKSREGGRYAYEIQRIKPKGR